MEYIGCAAQYKTQHAAYAERYRHCPPVYPRQRANNSRDRNVQHGAANAVIDECHKKRKLKYS